MSANVIQHRAPRRKRGSAWSWTTRHVVLLAVVVAGIIAASWLAPNVAAPPPIAPATPAHQTAAPTAPVAAPDLAAVDLSADLSGPPAPARRSRQTASRMGIPLNAAAMPAADYEILSAAELEGISQSRN